MKAHPELQEKRRKSEEKDAARVDRLMGMLPDAFLYRVEGVESCTAGRCYRLSFAPNAKWEPPDLEAEFLRGIAGEVWISLADERLTRLDARFVADADIGLGILGKVNKGGTVRLEQTDIGGNDWGTDPDDDAFGGEDSAGEVVERADGAGGERLLAGGAGDGVRRGG